MQNHPDKKPSAFQKFLRDRGYYIVLVLCVAAVGISGWLFSRIVSDNGQTDAEETLSVPLTPSDTAPAEKSDKTQKTGITGITKQTEKSENTEKTEQPESSQTPSPSSPQTPRTDTAENPGANSDVPAASMETTPAVTVRPLTGESINAYSVEALAYNETTRDWRVHNGIDIAAETGSKVAAARDGIVSAVYEDKQLGTTVAVEHKDGFTTYYSNLSAEPPVEVGQSLQAGEVLGTVGDSAVEEVALGGHLHFAVSQNGQPIDPNLFLEG